MAAVFASPRSWFLTNPNMKREKGWSRCGVLLQKLTRPLVNRLLSPQINPGSQLSTLCTSSVAMVTWWSTSWSRGRSAPLRR